MAVGKRLGYDDPLDAFGIHGVGGIVGALPTGVFAVEAVGGTPGLLKGDPGQLWPQLAGVAATLVWSGAVSFVTLKAIDATLGLRGRPEMKAANSTLICHPGEGP